MAEETQNDNNEFNWQCQIATGPDHAITINGKELKGLEEFLHQLAADNHLNWWELGNILLYLGVAQIAAADYHAGDTEAMQRFALGFTRMYPMHIKALEDGYNEIAPSKDKMN